MEATTTKTRLSDADLIAKREAELERTRLRISLKNARQSPHEFDKHVARTFGSLEILKSHWPGTEPLPVCILDLHDLLKAKLVGKVG